ncbi:MAG: NAD(P)/FAD-dependent oxidoreductase [Rhizobacter sp.]|nr:NAD(P)/FAD-dependent oxidoreductase [Rhizobacter sp.]
MDAPPASPRPEASAAGRPRVLVIGCGFGGIEAVRTLSKAPVEITVVDRTNHHLFQPLLYQVATAGLSAPAISAPIRHALRKEMARGNLTILKAEVRAIDVGARTAKLDRGDTIAWDHLILAAGATNSYFGHNEWERFAPGLKTLADAFDIRARMIGAFEHAERTDDRAERERALTFVVIGGGPTGVEMAGTMIEIARHTLRREFRRIDPATARVLLVEGAPRILGTFIEKQSKRAEDELRHLGVEVHTNVRVTAIDGDGVDCEATIDGHTHRERIAARTVIWGAGVAGVPLGAELARGTGATVDRAGRVVVEADLSIAGHPEISVIGDLASATSYGPRGTRLVPGVSPAAKQMGRTVAANILRRLRREPTMRFRYRDYGNLATIGRKAAVVELAVPGLGALRFAGFGAWLFWLFAHIYFLIGFRSRLIVMLEWGWAYFTYERGARVVAETATATTASRPS